MNMKKVLLIFLCLFTIFLGQNFCAFAEGSVTISGHIDNLPSCVGEECELEVYVWDYENYGNDAYYILNNSGNFTLNVASGDNYFLTVWGNGFPSLNYCESCDGGLTFSWDNITTINATYNQTINMVYPTNDIVTISGHIDNLPSCIEDEYKFYVSITNGEHYVRGEYLTNDSGNFTLNVPSGDNYRLEVSGNGFPDLYYCENCDDNITLLRNNYTCINATYNQTINMVYPADNIVTISGHIDNLPSCIGDECKFWVYIGSVIGEYINNIRNFTLDVPSGYNYTLRIVGKGFSDLYYCENCDGNVDTILWANSRINATYNQTINMVYPADNIVTISGHIDNLPKCVGDGCDFRVYVLDDDWDHMGSTYIDNSGNFILNVVSGDNYFLTVRRNGFPDLYYCENCDNNITPVWDNATGINATNNQTIEMTYPMATISGHIDNLPAGCENSSCEIFLVDENVTYQNIGELDNNGNFTLYTLLDYDLSNYFIQISNNETCYYLGNEGTLLNDFGSAVSVSELIDNNIVTSSQYNYGAINGTITIENFSGNSSNCKIYVYADSEKSHGYTELTLENCSSQNGTYSCSYNFDLFPTIYTLEVWPSDECYLDGGIYNGSKNLTQNWDEKKYISVQPERTTKVDLTLKGDTLYNIKGNVTITNDLTDCTDKIVGIYAQSDSVFEYKHMDVTLNSSCEGIFELKVKPASDYRIWIDPWDVGLPGGFLNDGCIDNNTSTKCSIIGDYELAGLVDVSRESKNLGTITINDNYHTIKGQIELSGIDDGNYTVYVHVYSEDTGGYAGSDVNIHVTNSYGEGNYTLKVPEGKNYRIFVDPSDAGFSNGFLTNQCETSDNCSLTGDWMEAGRFNVESDLTLEKLTLSKDSFATISGQVSFNNTVTGHEDTYIWIDAWCAEENQWAGTNVYIPKDEVSSNYTLLLAPCSSYKVKVWAGQYVAKVIPDTLSLSLGDNKTVNITLTSGNTIGGIVINATESGISNVWVEAFKVEDNLPIFVGSDVTDESGNFTIKGLENGNYTLVTFPPFEEDNSNYIMNFVPNIQTENRSVTIQMFQGISISGNVTLNGNPYSKADVFAWSNNGTTTNWFDDVFSWSEVNATGGFVLHGLAKGRDYVVCSNDFTGKYGSECKNIQIADNGTVSENPLVLSFTKGYKIVGYVNGTDYNPAQNQGQIAVFNSTDDLICSVSIYPNGYYETTPLPAGNYNLKVWMMGFEGNATVEITSNDVSENISVSKKTTIALNGTVDVSNLSDVSKVEVVAVEKDSSNNATGLTLSTAACENSNCDGTISWSIPSAPQPVSSYTVCAWAYAQNSSILNQKNCTLNIQDNNATNISITLQ